MPPSTRAQPFPPVGVMEPIRRAERLVKSIEDVATSVRGLPLLNSDEVWDRVRHVGLDEQMQFDCALVAGVTSLASGLRDVTALDEVDVESPTRSG